MNIEERFSFWTKKLSIVPFWDVKLEVVNDVELKKTGDFKIDPTDKKAIIIINTAGDTDNLEEVLVHELMHIKMYPLDQVCESLITSNFEEGSNGWNLAYNQFFENLEITVEELAKCFLLEFGQDKELAFGRCKKMKSFNELYDGLNIIE